MSHTPHSQLEGPLSLQPSRESAVEFSTRAVPSVLHKVQTWQHLRLWIFRLGMSGLHYGMASGRKALAAFVDRLPSLHHSEAGG